MLRRVACCMAFRTEGTPYSTKDPINTLATLIGNAGMIPPAHYNEVYVAWAKANATAGINDHDSP